MNTVMMITGITRLLRKDISQRQRRFPFTNYDLLLLLLIKDEKDPNISINNSEHL